MTFGSECVICESVKTPLRGPVNLSLVQQYFFSLSSFVLFYIHTEQNKSKSPQLTVHVHATEITLTPSRFSD